MNELKTCTSNNANLMNNVKLENIVIKSLTKIRSGRILMELVNSKNKK